MRSDLLLDTCAAIWLVQGAFLEREALDAMARASEEDRPLRLSLITAWELGLLAKTGKAAMAAAPSAIFQSFLELPGVRAEPLTADVLINSSLLPGKIHGDPADRIIVATARALELTVITRDRAILEYARQGHVLALPC
jgi:PIN domain nuclease of toxin-antitoxin system